MNMKQSKITFFTLFFFVKKIVTYKYQKKKKKNFNKFFKSFKLQFKFQ